MATANFHNINTGCVSSYELEDEIDCEDLIANLESELAGIVCDYRFNNFEPYLLCSYPSQAFDKIKIAVELTVIVRTVITAVVIWIGACVI
ncbi:MAG: hypothetical protein DRH89_01245 [Candidatus Cloacimonadota bacterium]|nr:MAG: hypothetical protein DRH89_01245 [Candidatus Cloacimonadota bacterium]